MILSFVPTVRSGTESLPSLPVSNVPRDVQPSPSALSTPKEMPETFPSSDCLIRSRGTVFRRLTKVTVLVPAVSVTVWDAASAV